MVKVANYIDMKRILFFEEGTSKSEALSALIDGISEDSRVSDNAQFRADIYERESVMSTGIGLGIAIPHCKSSGVDDVVIAIGVARKPIEYEALDGKPVQFIVMIAAGKDQHKQYLQLLSKIAFLLKNKRKRESVISATTIDELYAIFSLI